MSTKLNQQRDHYSLRKFKSAGLASALIGVSTISFLLTNNKPVKAAANSSEPNEEANNDAMHKEQQDDIQSGTTTTTTETRQAPTTKVTPLKPKKQTDKQESAKEQTKLEESKPKEEPEQAKKPVKQVEENKTAKTKKQAPTAEAKTPVKKQPDKNGSETKKQQKEDSKNILKDLTETNAKLHQSLTNIKSNDDASVDPIATEASDDAKQTAAQKPVKIDLETQDFVLPRKRVSRLDVSMLAMNLAAMPADNSWKDPINHGFTRTNVGYTKDYRNYQWIAKQGGIQLGTDYNPIVDLPIDQTHDINDGFGFGARINATIDKDMAESGHDILVGTIVNVSPDDRHFMLSGDENTKNNQVFFKDQYIGYIWSRNGYDGQGLKNSRGGSTASEIDYFFHPDLKEKIASDLTFSFNIDHTRAIDCWANHYPFLRGTNSSNPAKNTLVTVINDQTHDNNYTITTNGQQFNSWKETGNHVNDAKNISMNTSLYWNNITSNGFYSNSDQPYQSQHIHKVFEIKRLPNPGTGKINKMGKNDITIWWHMDYRMRDYKDPTLVKQNIWRPAEYWQQAIKLKDDLTPEEVMAEAQKEHKFVVSYRSNGTSALIGMDWDDEMPWETGDWAVQGITNYIKDSYTYNISDPQNGDKYIDATINYYKNRKWQSNAFWYEIGGFSKDANIPVTEAVNDVTPGQTPKNGSINGLNPNGTSANTALYRQVTINYLDDDNNEKLIGTDSVVGITGQNLIVDPLTDLNLPVKYVLNDYNNINYGIVQDNNNKPINIHVKHKIIGNVSDLHENAHNERDYFIDQVRSKADPNITIIHDQDKDYQAKYNDVNDQNDKINQISQDYINQTTTIANQIVDYNKKLANYNTKKQEFIESLKKQGLWSDGMVDPTSVKQSLHLDLNGHNNSIAPKITILDNNDAYLDGNNVYFKNDNAITGDFVFAEYDGITNSYYGDKQISKMTVTVSNIRKGAKSAGGHIAIGSGINNGIWRDNIAGADLDIKFYDNNGNLITFGDDAYLTVSSLNGRSNGDGSTADNTEAVKLLSDGQAMQLPQSGVKVHSDGGMYMDGGYDSPESLGLPSSLDYWDNSTSPSRIFGSAMIHVKGNHIKLRSYDYSDYSVDHNISNPSPWFIWSTMLPPIAFDQQPPKLELHYHNDNLQLTKTSTYQVIEKMPSPKYGKDQTILKTTITAGKDIARDLVTGRTQETQFTGRNTHGNVDIGQTDGVDQTVIWGKQPTIIGYHFNPFQAETKEHFDHVGGTDWTDHGAILSVSSTDNTIHFDYLVGQNYQSATNLGDSLILSDLPDSQTWYVTLSPNQQNTQVVYVDDDANGKQVGNQTISGLTDQETDHIFLDQFDHSKYTIDGNHLSKSAIQSDQLDGSITSYNVYEQTSPDYANYNFVNIYNKHNNQWTNVTSDPNNRLIIHLKEKTIGTTDPGNIIDPIHNLKGENVGPNITWIQDPNRETVVNDDQAAIDNALNNIANDYNTQEESIRNQLKDYYNRLDEYNQRRQDFIKDLKAKGYWNDSYIDLTNAGQHLQLDHDENNVMQIESLDPNFATVNGHMINVKPNVDHQGEFAKVTYTNLSHAFYDNEPISKIEVYYGDWYYSNMSDRDYCGVLVGSDLAGGYTFNHSTGLRVRIKLFDQNGNQIKLDKQSFLTLGSLNSSGPGGIESVKLLSKGKAYAIPGSSVTVHDGNWLYSNQANGTWNGVGGWDTNDPTDPKYSIGAGLFDITGDTDIIIHDYSGDVTNVHNRNSGVGAKWATTLTTIPPMAFEEKAPTLTIHYHTNSLRSNTNRKYSVTYTYPPEVSSYYDNYTYADIVQAHRYAGKNLVTGQKAYSHYYGDRVSDDITQNKALRLNWNNIYGFTTKSDIPDGAIINNNQGIAITKDHTAFNNDFDNLADSYNYHVYYTPGEVLAKAQFIDEDTGQLVQENPFYGYVGQTVDVSNIPVPKNYRIADDSSKPDTYKMLSSSDNTAPDDQGFIVYVVQDTQTVQDAPRNIHIVVNGHDNLSGDITYTRDGIYNKVTGQTTWNPWTVYNSSASLNGMTDMYTLNGADITDLENNNINYTVDANGSRIANGTLTQDNSNYDLTLSPDSPYFDGKTDLTYVINLNTVPANKEQYIIYEDRETHEQLGESSIKGPVGSQQPYTVKHFDGYLDPQGLPPTLEIKEDDTPYVIYLDRLAVYIPANNPVNEGDSIHDYDGDYVGDDTFPGGLNEGALNHYVTRTIYVTKNGQTTKNVTTYHFTRNAYYYPANGEIKYTDWSEDQTFPVFKLDHNGVTPIVEGSQTDANGDIPAVTVGANDSDITIDVSYESNDKGITLIWQDSDMSNREIRRRSMSIDQFKQSDNPEKAVLPDFKYTDEDHPQTFNDYSKNFNFKLEDTDGNILAQGDLSNLKSVGSLLKEKNNGYLLIFSKAHGYQYVQNSPDDEYPPIKSTYRIVNVTFPDGQTVQFRYGARWKLADRRRDMTTGIKNAISNEGYIPASYIGTKDGTYPEINDEFIKNLLIQNGYVDDLSGYTIKADGDTSFMSLNADSPNEVVNVSFVGKRAGTKVEIVDTAGNVLAYNYLVGHIGQTLDINYPDIPAGYSNAGYAYYPKTYTFTKEHPDPIIVRVAKTGYANGQSVPTDRNLTTNSNGDTRSNNIEHANMFTSLFVMPQNQGQSSGTSQNNKPHSLQDQLQNLKTSKQQKHLSQLRSNAQPKQDFTQAQRQAPKPKSNFTRVKPNKIDHNNAMDASLFVRSRGSSTAKLDDSHQDLLSKLSNLGASKAAPVKHSNAQPVNTSSINHNFTTNQNLAQKLSNLKKTSYVQDRSVNVDPENNLDPTVEAATVEQDKTNAKDQTKKLDHSKEALVASLFGLSSAATAGAYAYKKKKNVKDETFNK